MSTLKADTIVASDGSSPVTLTKQRAILACVGYNMSGTTYYGASNSALTECFNTSSFTDVSAGKLETSLTNAPLNNEFIISAAAIATNNNVSHESTSTTSVVKTRGTDADSNAAQDNLQYFHVSGSLA